LSSDNPKSEDPLKIFSDVVVGLQKSMAIHDRAGREKAIGLAIDEARAGDILLWPEGSRKLSDSRGPYTGFDDRESRAPCVRERGFDEPEMRPGFGT